MSMYAPASPPPRRRPLRHASAPLRERPRRGRYVRVKRKNQTIFLHVEPSDNLASVKAKCAETVNVPPTSVQLLHTDKVREDSRVSATARALVVERAERTRARALRACAQSARRWAPERLL